MPYAFDFPIVLTIPFRRLPQTASLHLPEQRSILVVVEAGYRTIDHTADKAIEVWAPDLGELILQAARGLIDLLVEPGQLAPACEVEISVTAEGPEVLLHDALSEILYLVEDDGLMPLRVRLASQDGPQVSLNIGVVEMATAEPHVSGLIKAVTYHNLEIEQTSSGLRTQVVFDT